MERKTLQQAFQIFNFMRICQISELVTGSIYVHACKKCVFITFEKDHSMSPDKCLHLL